MSSIKIFTDGGARGNPGPAASAFVVTRNNKEIAEDHKYLGETTNNVAEYTAVIMALDWLCEQEFSSEESATFYIDSLLLVNQINGEYKVKSERLRRCHRMVMRRILSCKSTVKFVHVKREKNKRADSLVNKILDENMR